MRTIQLNAVMATRLLGLCRHLRRLSTPAVKRSVAGANRRATIWRSPLQRQCARLTRSTCTATTPAEGHGSGVPHEVPQDSDVAVATNSSSVKENCVVRLRGLPFQASLKDVQEFLVGLNVVPRAIIFDVNTMGARTGAATVALESAEQASLALKQRRYYRDQRYIEVLEATRQHFLDLQEHVQSSQPFVRMHGLPFDASEADIVKFFDPETTTQDGEKGVFIVPSPNWRSIGVAFAVFSSKEEVEKAMQKNRCNLGSRYVELYECSLKEFQTVLERSGTADQKSHFVDMLGLKLNSSASAADEMGGRERTCVKLRGLPWSATADTVVDFFGDLRDDIVTGGIHIMLDSMNRPTGHGYVRMKSVAAAGRASEELHKQYIEDRYIEVFQCSGDEMARGSGPYRGGARVDMGGGRRRFGNGGTTVHCRGLPYSATERDVAEFFQDYGVKESDVDLVYNSTGHCTGIAYVSFPSNDLAHTAVRHKHRQYIGRRYVELSTF